MCDEDEMESLSTNSLPTSVRSVNLEDSKNSNAWRFDTAPTSKHFANPTYAAIKGLENIKRSSVRMTVSLIAV